MNSFSGNCHCGNIGIAFETQFDSNTLPLRACGCTFCTRHAAHWTSDQDGALHISVKDESMLSRYRFGTATADFLLCARCGVVACAVCHLDGQDFAVLNTCILDDRKALTGKTAITDFDDENNEQRLARRKTNWIPRVTIDIQS